MDSSLHEVLIELAKKERLQSITPIDRNGGQHKYLLVFETRSVELEAHEAVALFNGVLEILTKD